jgi:hypothetical protein
MKAIWRVSQLEIMYESNLASFATGKMYESYLASFATGKNV